MHSQESGTSKVEDSCVRMSMRSGRPDLCICASLGVLLAGFAYAFGWIRPLLDIAVGQPLASALILSVVVFAVGKALGSKFFETLGVLAALILLVLFAYLPFLLGGWWHVIVEGRLADGREVLIVSRSGALALLFAALPLLVCLTARGKPETTVLSRILHVSAGFAAYATVVLMFIVLSVPYSSPSLADKARRSEEMSVSRAEFIKKYTEEQIRREKSK